MRRWRAAAVLGLAVIVTACDEGLAGLNVDPNNPVEVGAEYLLPNAIEASVSRVIGSGLNMDVTGLWVQHYVEHLYTVEDLYDITNSAVSGHWSSFYAGPMQDFQEVIEKGTETNRPNTTAMGMIMKAWTAQVMTDLWGDIGYSEALQGRTSDVLTVAYDTQEQVYNQLLEEVTAAAAMIDPDGLKIESGDILYGGDMEQWRMFANALRMRMAMRLSEIAPQVAAQEFAAAHAAGGFASNDDSAILWYLDNGVNRHPIHSYELSRDDHSVSRTMIEMLKDLNDPRLEVYAKPNAAGNYWGLANGVFADPPLDSVSRIGDFYSRADAPGILISYPEQLFLEAEAAERGWITGDPAALYTAAIRASMEFNEVATADINAYLAQPEIAYAGGADGLEQIWTQKWIALFGQGPEAYSEWRRTATPVLPIGPDAENDGQIPLRLFYPASEESYNREAVEAARARQGGADLNDPVWWDVTGGGQVDPPAFN
ncbi:MAG: SusD/RagB family nutrient-binding outer membrane lipoprotein [Longimicrobiales bacterium]